MIKEKEGRVNPRVKSLLTDGRVSFDHLVPKSLKEVSLLSL